MNTIEVKPIDTTIVATVEKDASLILTQAAKIKIIDQKGYNFAAELLQKIKTKIKSLDDLRKSIKNPILEAGRKLDALFNLPLERYTQARNSLSTAIVAYDDEQETIRFKEQQRLEREVEKKRQEAEAKAETARARGDDAKAEKYEEKAATIVAPVVAPKIEQPKGLHFTEHWYAEVKDFKVLPDQYKLPNMPMLNKSAQATKGIVPIPGVIFKMEKIPVNRKQT